MRRYGLVIGCGTAEFDAERIETLLNCHAGWEEVCVVRSPKKRQEIVTAQTTLFSKMKPEDFLFVYYAGHAALVSHQTTLELTLGEETYPAVNLVNVSTG